MTKSVKDEEKEEEDSRIHDKENTPNAAMPEATTAFTTKTTVVEKESHKEDNAFSRLMAPKGKWGAGLRNAVSQNDNVPMAINVVNVEHASSEVATPKTTRTASNNTTSRKEPSSNSRSKGSAKRPRKRIVAEVDDDILNSSSNDFADAPNVRSKKEPINVSEGK